MAVCVVGSGAQENSSHRQKKDSCPLQVKTILAEVVAMEQLSRFTKRRFKRSKK